MKIYALGYSESASTSYLLNYLISNGVSIEGVIFPKNTLTRSWRRLAQKARLRGVYPTIRRALENQALRKKQISQICQEHINKVFYVDDINSDQVREILVSHNVDLLILTATPIIKPILIDINGLVILNAHTGWLPDYRGLDANLKALRDGHHPGVSIHKVTEGIDAGEIYLREAFEISLRGNILKQIDDMELKLAGKLLLEAVNLKSMNMLKPIATSETLGNYEPPLTIKEKSTIIQEIQRDGR